MNIYICNIIAKIASVHNLKYNYYVKIYFIITFHTYEENLTHNYYVKFDFRGKKPCSVLNQ